MKAPEWRWLTKGEALILHERQISTHGGPFGIRDQGLLESALSRAENLLTYGEPDIADLAAAYAYGLAKNHPFVDGNKRTAFVALELCLAMNGYSLAASDAESVLIMLDLASGKLDDHELAAWIRLNLAEI